MKFIADFHIHSKYSRATSRDMDIPNLAKWAKLKGINLVGTGDFTHPIWLKDLKKELTPMKKQGLHAYCGVTFILSAEIANIYSQNGKVYRVHNLIMAPSFEIVDKINAMLSKIGNLAADGRPILGMSCLRLAEELYNISEDIMLVPAHIWTPWFSVFGSNSGFDDIYQAYGKHTDWITALETGLSSDPIMNWRLSQLDKFSLISNSDSHSPSRIGREANVFDCGLDYMEIKNVLKNKDKSKFLYTLEFFPEEGKYHYDGHRACQVRLEPKETKKYNGICPKCKKPMTKGVMYRVDQLADRDYGFVPDNAIPFKNMVPLIEIVAEANDLGVTSKAVEKQYLEIVYNQGTEFDVLINFSEKELFAKLPQKIAQGIQQVRQKQLKILPGYDGEYGEIKIFGVKPQPQIVSAKDHNQQISLF